MIHIAKRSKELQRPHHRLIKKRRKTVNCWIGRVVLNKVNAKIKFTNEILLNLY